MDTLNTLFLGLSTLALVILVAVVVCALLEILKVVRSLHPLMEAAEKSLPTAIGEVNLALKGLRDVTAEAIAIMSDIRELSGAARAVGENVMRVTENTKRLSHDVEGITSAVSGRISGIRAGVRVALSIIQKGFLKRQHSVSNQRSQ
jgi:uncharacterized protein YoxC